MHHFIKENVDLIGTPLPILIKAQEEIQQSDLENKKIYGSEALNYLNDFIALAVILGTSRIESAPIGEDMVLVAFDDQPEGFVLPWNKRVGFKNREALAVLEKIRNRQYHTTQ